MPVVDQTLMLLLKGYAWLPDLRRRAAGDVVRTRVLGRRATGLCGPDAARFFYDEENVERRAALPGPVRSTLFGHGSVHGLDGAAHRVRKAMFTSLFSGPAVAALVAHVTTEWDLAVASWEGRPVVLFDESALMLTRAVCEWTGLAVDEEDLPELAADLVAMVDGLGTAGPRHWRARQARRRREAWLDRLVRDLRNGCEEAPPDSAAEVVAVHRDAGGRPLPPRVAAVELLNVLRPTVAVSWLITYAAHALHRRPEHRARLAGGDPEFAEAFAHELRRFYPFAPLLGGRAARELDWRGTHIPRGSLILLDVYGQHHDPRYWRDPYTFDPRRFLGAAPGPYDLIPQGGGDAHSGHRCPGEALTMALLRAVAPRLARLDYEVPRQDLTISLRRMPARPASGFILVPARPAPLASPASPFPHAGRRAPA
ncbi:cytochrome P450 [Nonomuraea sp. N2-4H]|jgi:fatty-acid peroxygenase|uniref:cytochrome P450 n=1 Tax=unclassified Nonomuraea TaxID=2593643 RepID=UPI0032565BEC